MTKGSKDSLDPLVTSLIGTELVPTIQNGANKNFTPNIIRDFIGSDATFIEYMQDMIAGFLQQGTNVTIAYDDANNKLNISTSASGAAVPIDIQIFYNNFPNINGGINQTWTKPTNGQKIAFIKMIAAGGGGGSGRRGAAASGRSGGCGGNGGQFVTGSLPLSDLGTTEPVVVGIGGIGGISITTDNTNGSSGTNGGSCKFGSSTIGNRFGATGGNGGTFGGTGASFPGSTQASPYFQGVGSNTSVTGAAPSSQQTFYGAAGGGAGGSISTADVLYSGSFSTYGGVAHGTPTGSGANAGTSASLNGQSATNPTTGTFAPGSGGGGGYPSITSNAGNGGNGQNYGGGGGGGGASLNGFNSGSGGNGGDSILIVVSI